MLIELHNFRFYGVSIICLSAAGYQYPVVKYDWNGGLIGTELV